PPTATQLADARAAAAKAGLVIEARNTQASLATISAAATAAGALLALGVLALTVGLIRTEAAGDLRTLTATGATSTTPPPLAPPPPTARSPCPARGPDRPAPTSHWPPHTAAAPAP